MTYYKFLRAGRIGPFSDFQWPEVGEWVTAEGDIGLCENGIHAFTKPHAIGWLDDELYEIQLRGKIIEGEDKVVASSGRLVRRIDTWNEKSARLFACDCAERVLPLFEKERPKDNRPRKAIGTARLYAEGKATDKQLDAAWDAAWDAARGAARGAAWGAAWGAARDAAWAAAWAAARGAARAAEREWQIERFWKVVG